MAFAPGGDATPHLWLVPKVRLGCFCCVSPGYLFRRTLESGHWWPRLYDSSSVALGSRGASRMKGRPGGDGKVQTHHVCYCSTHEAAEEEEEEEPPVPVIVRPTTPTEAQSTVQAGLDPALGRGGPLTFLRHWPPARPIRCNMQSINKTPVVSMSSKHLQLHCSLSRGARRQMKSHLATSLLCSSCLALSSAPWCGLVLSMAGTEYGMQ